MSHEFWGDRWARGQIGFHEAKPNDMLVAHADVFEGKKRVLVPLAGKSDDMRYLASRGHEVVGVEFVREAVDAFFREQGVEPREHEIGPFRAFTGGDVTLVHHDFFALGPELGTFDAIYDRAALVAIDPSMREKYAEVCRSLLAPDGVTLLIAFSYDQSKAPGPPFSVEPDAVRALFGQATELGTRSSDSNPRLAALGIAMTETAYRLQASGFRLQAEEATPEKA